jgi:glutaredoxin
MLKGLVVCLALAVSCVQALAAELVMYRRAGCPYCLAFDREIGPIYPRTDVGKRLPLRHVDIEKGPDRSVTLKSPIRYTPTFVIVEDGQERARIEGYPGDFFFWGLLEKHLL